MDNWQLVVLVVVVVIALLALAVLVRARSGTAGTRAGPPPELLAGTTRALGAALRRAWGSGLGEATWTGIEEALIAADVGVETSLRIVEGVRSAGPGSPEAARSELGSRLRSELSEDDRALSLRGAPAVVLVVGVNGTGKTTTIAKLAWRLGNEGRTVMLGAADTFRAAAGEQLRAWGDRLGVRVVSGQDGADPASVAFDAVSAASAGGADVVIIDTAGRLHAKRNLMSELAKIHRVAGGQGGVDEVLLVLDATAGQNGLAQVREFASAVPVSGIVLTKLDGTARGGIVIAVENDFGVPVKLIGVGEGLEDLLPFDPDSFVAALLEES